MSESSAFSRRLAIYCADIGSVAKNRFGWARQFWDLEGSQVSTGTDIRQLVRMIAVDLNKGRPVALGLECPLFVPLHDDPIRLTAARNGEGSRAWCAGAGAGALAAGLTESAWILQEVHRHLKATVSPFLEWGAFTQAPLGLFLWEAFVTGHAKGETHTADAEIAVRCFTQHLPDITAANAIEETSVYSLIGAALLRTGWSTDLRLLETPCVVIRA